MTFDGEKFGQETAAIVRSYVEKATAPLKAQIEALEKRLAEVEGRGLKFAGVWQRALGYPRGSVVTHEGSAWVALRDTGEGSRPGSDLGEWQLAVKSGRDAR